MASFAKPLALAASLALLATQAPAAPTLEFAGYSWLVRTYPGGPGPNVWDGRNAFVDADGLHLRIDQVEGVWTAAEVFMLGPPLGFGTYEFEITADLVALDTNAVLGLFNYPDDATAGLPGANEIDIEFSQWGDRQNPNRLNWNIHPAPDGVDDMHHAIPLELDGMASTHRFTWMPQSIAFVSFAGYADTGLTPIADWTFAPADPAAQVPQHPLVVHLNLWLVEGRAPLAGKPVEIVIRNFRFTPA